MEVHQMLFFENDKEILDTGFVQSLTYHSHLHKYLEFGYILHGSTRLKVNDKEYDVSSGQAYLITPYQIHSFKDKKDSNLFAATIIFNDSLISSFNSIFRQNRIENPVIQIDYNEISQYVEKIHELQISSTKYRLQIIEAYLLLLLSIVLPQLTLIPDNHSSNANIPQNVLIYCNEHFKEDISIEKIASDLNISKSYVSQVFNNTLKISFSECINQLRINESILLISGGEKNFSKIAFESGFNSIRSFNRNFTKFTGTSPSEYIKNLNISNK